MKKKRCRAIRAEFSNARYGAIYDRKQEDLIGGYSGCEYFELRKPIDKGELDKYYCGHEDNMESECEYASCPLDYGVYTFKDSGGEKTVGELVCSKCGDLFKNHNINSQDGFICKGKLPELHRKWSLGENPCDKCKHEFPSISQRCKDCCNTEGFDGFEAKEKTEPEKTDYYDLLCEIGEIYEEWNCLGCYTAEEAINKIEERVRGATRKAGEG